MVSTSRTAPESGSRPIELQAPGEGIGGGTACDRDPVHVPGTVQPHGILLALSPDPGHQVLAAGGALPLPDPRRLDRVLLPDSAAAVAAALAAPLRNAAADDQVLERLRSQDGRHWTGLLRRGGPVALLELEPEPPADPAAARAVLGALNAAIAALRTQPDPASACTVAARHLQALTGFDRVMAYRFMPDWSGAVVAEALRDTTVDSYLGLVFPASDIPAPARALYASNRLRLIPDAAAPQLPLRGDAGTGPIDLSRAVLRGVAPVHLQYLANMGVHASMSVAITLPEDGGAARLWGLLACHHQQGPLRVDHERRQAAETISHALSWRLAELAEHDELHRAEAMGRVLMPFLADPEATDPDRLSSATPVLRVPDRPGAVEALLGACEAAGVAVLGGEEPLRLGLLPSAPFLRRLGDWLDRTGPGRILVTDRLATLLPPALAGELDAAGPEHAVCGLLAMPLAERPADAPAADAGSAGQGGWVLWFRGELRREVVWAGHKPDTPDPAAALTPRASFAAWREQVSGRSAAWADGSVAAARLFRDAVVAAFARRSLRTAEANAELRRRNETIRFFADAATHDLKEPLWQIQVLCGLIRDGLAELFGPPAPDAASGTAHGAAARDPAHEALARQADELDLHTMSGLVVSSAGRMRAMIDDLARFAVAGRDSERAEPVPLRSLADEALADLGEPLRAAPDAMLDLHGLDGIAVTCDPLQLRRVFQNLFSNALKYRHQFRPLVLTARAERTGSTVRVAVEDNGVGFDPSDRHALFEPFRRFRRDDAAADEGLGLGLSICQRIVSAHGGTIEAVPLQPGSRFSFVLRDLTPEAPAGEQASP